MGFLDYDKIKDGKMCHHIVCVLPYCASCDALESLLKRNSKVFKNLADYKVLNISGHEMPREYKEVEGVRKAIDDCEKNGQKTLTLTVNRMLTGSTVPQWDTMLYFKDTSSPQEYDQAIFRLQNQFVQELKSEGVDGKTSDVIKFNKKPQTLLVDFDPARLFRMQEEKSKIYNVNEDKAGNSKLEERIREELTVSPVVCMNAGKIRRVEAAEIMEEISNYSRDRGVADEASKIDVDVAAATKSEVLMKTILKENPLGDKKGFVLDPSKGDGDDYEFPDVLEKVADNNDPTSDASAETSKEQEELRRIANQFRAYCARILFFAFLTKSKVQSLEDIIACMDAGKNARIAANLRVSKKVLKAIQKYFNRFILSAWDYKIANLNKLSRDESLDPLQRATTANSKFDRLGESEIVTPGKIADDMVALLPEEELKRIAAEGEKILDISGKTGEFAIALYKRYQQIDSKIDVSNLILTIPTSSHAYEFTRKVYEALGLNVNNIADQFTAYDLIEVKNKDGEIDYERIKNLLTQKKSFNKITMNDNVTSKGKHMKIAAVIGNPPYQENLASGRSLATQLFPKFMEMSIGMTPRYWTLITPQKWFTADGQDNSFPKLREQLRRENHFQIIVSKDGKKLFNRTELGVVSYYLWNSSYTGDCKFIEASDNGEDSVVRPLFMRGQSIVLPQNKFVSIVDKIRSTSFVPLNSISTGRDAFGINGKDFESKSAEKAFRGAVKVQCAHEQIRYYARDKVVKGLPFLDSWNVFTSKGNGGAGLLTEGKKVSIIGKAFVAEPGMACTDSLIPFGRFATKLQADHLKKYMATKFLRFLVGILKVSQNLYQNVYAFVPLQDFTSKSDIDWSKSTKEIDQQLYLKYQLSEEEQKFIESMIKPME